MPGVEVRIASLDNDATLKLGGKSSHTPPELFTSIRRYRPQNKLTFSTRRGRRDSHKVHLHSPASQSICAHNTLQIPKCPKRILQQPQRHLVLPRLRRLVPNRRHRQARPARLSLDHRSSERDDQGERVRPVPHTLPARYSTTPIFALYSSCYLTLLHLQLPSRARRARSHPLLLRPSRRCSRDVHIR